MSLVVSPITESRDELLKEVINSRCFAQAKCMAHFQMCRIYARRNNMVGVPSVVLSAIVGTAIFASLSKHSHVGVEIVVGLLAVTASVLSGLQTFFGFSAVSAHHKAAAVRYDSARHKLDALDRALRFKSFNMADLDATLEKLQDIELEMNKAAEQAPSIRSSVERRARIKMDAEKTLRDSASA